METSNTNFADQIISSVFSDENLINEMLDTYGLNWKVSKMPLYLPNQKPTGFFGIVREDTESTFQTCREGYEPFQNYQLGELLLRICEQTGYELHSGGKFNDGGKVYLQLKTGNEIKGLGKNGTTVEGYVTGINSHDGTTSLKWGAVNFTICCRNTFAYAQRELKNSARHTQSIHAKVEQSIRSINGIIEQEKSLFEKFITLSEIPVKKANIGMIVEQITGIDMNMPISEVEEKHSTYSINRSTELLSSINTEMKSKGETLWGLFSGVTHYTSHKMPIAKRDNARIESKYTGTDLSIDNKALSSILELV